ITHRRVERKTAMSNNNQTNNTNKDTLQVPRTVIGVSRLCSQMEYYDRAYARALSKGDLGRAKECEQHLYQIDSLLARVSDRLWSVFCAVEDQNMMGALIENLGE